MLRPAAAVKPLPIPRPEVLDRALDSSVPPMSAPLDPRRCPLCQGDNACGLALGKESCWCMTRRMDETVLDRVPEQARNRACVCEACGASPDEPGGTTRRLALRTTRDARDPNFRQ